LKPLDIRIFEKKLIAYLEKFGVKKVNYLPRIARKFLVKFLTDSVLYNKRDEKHCFSSCWSEKHPIGVILDNAGNIIN
jgi:hypothetical protein